MQLKAAARALIRGLVRRNGVLPDEDIQDLRRPAGRRDHISALSQFLTKDRNEADAAGQMTILSRGWSVRGALTRSLRARGPCPLRLSCCVPVDPSTQVPP
jgi:hypothetical protein